MFKPPEDVKAFWIAPHCGPGTRDFHEDCGFCGETHLDCALALTECIRQGKANNDVVKGYSDEGPCGGSGFWCPGCKRFWAQNGCGENNGLEHQASDGAELVHKDRSIYCICGQRLMDDGFDYEDQHQMGCSRRLSLRKPEPGKRFSKTLGGTLDE